MPLLKVAALMFAIAAMTAHLQSLPIKQWYVESYSAVVCDRPSSNWECFGSLKNSVWKKVFVNNSSAFQFFTKMFFRNCS